MFESPHSRLSRFSHRKSQQALRNLWPKYVIVDRCRSMKWEMAFLPSNDSRLLGTCRFSLSCVRAQGFPSFPSKKRKKKAPTQDVRRKHEAPRGGGGCGVVGNLSSDDPNPDRPGGTPLLFFSASTHTMTMRCFQFLSVACALDTASGFGLGGGRVAGHHSVASSTRRCEVRRVVSCFSCDAVVRRCKYSAS